MAAAVEDSQAVETSEQTHFKVPTNPGKPKKVLTEKQLEILAKARAKAAETRKARAEQKAKDASLQEELKKLEAQKLVAQVAEARKHVQEKIEPEKAVATPAPKQEPPPKESAKEEPFVPAKKGVQKRNARWHVEEPVPVPRLLGMASTRRRTASYDRGHWDDHNRSTIAPGQPPFDAQRAAADDKRASWSDLSLTEEWEYGPQYGFGDDDDSNSDDDAFDINALICDRCERGSTDSEMDALVRRMLDFVFDD
ncbi:g7778 [Coccomyxa elongata]